MRIFTGLWAFVAVVMGVLLVTTATHRLWGYAVAACGVVPAVVSVFPHHRVPRWAAFGAMAFAVGATAAGLAVSRTDVCCVFA